MASDGSIGDPSSLPMIYLLLENPSKSNNLGPILRCASAFGIVTVVAIGFSKCSVQGSHGASKHVQIIDFPVGDQAIDFIRKDCRCNSVVGLMGPLPDGYDDAGCAISEDEASGGNICFALSKDRHCLPLSLARFCDEFVHIPHMALHADNGALLDTPSCMSILLHEYTTRAAFDERTFQGHKFEVACPLRAEVDDADAKQTERAVARAMKEATVESLVTEGTLGSFFGTESDGAY